MRLALLLVISLALVGCCPVNSTSAEGRTNIVFKFFCTPDGHAIWHSAYISGGVVVPMIDDVGLPVSCGHAMAVYPGLYEEVYF